MKLTSVAVLKMAGLVILSNITTMMTVLVLSLLVRLDTFEQLIWTQTLIYVVVVVILTVVGNRLRLLEMPKLMDRPEELWQNGVWLLGIILIGTVVISQILRQQMSWSLVSVMTLVGIFEEFLYRGVITQTLIKELPNLPLWFIGMIQATLFGVVAHGDGMGMINLLVRLPLGMLFFGLWLWTKKLTFPMAGHALYNIFVVMIGEMK